MRSQRPWASRLGLSCARRKPSVCTARKSARYGIGMLQQHILALLTLLALLILLALLALLALLPRSLPKPPKNAKSAKKINGALALLEECDPENPGDRARSFFRDLHSRNLGGNANSL